MDAQGWVRGWPGPPRIMKKPAWFSGALNMFLRLFVKLRTLEVVATNLNKRWFLLDDMDDHKPYYQNSPKRWVARFQQPIKNGRWTSSLLRQPPPLWKSWESPNATFRPQDNSPFIKDDGSIIVPWESPNAALFLGGRWWHWEGVGPVDIHKSKIIWNSLQNGLEDSPNRGWLIGFLNHYQYVFVCFLCSKKLRMIPVFRGCFYPRPRSQSGQNRGSMSGLCVGNQCTWITTTFAYFIKVTGKESMAWKYSVRPRNLTWNPKMKVWKMRFLFKWVSFRFHVSFPGCNGCLSNPYSKLPWRILMIQNDICDALPGMSQVKSSAGVTTRALGCDFSHVVFLDGGFKYVLFSPLFGEDSHFDQYFFKGVETTNQIFMMHIHLRNWRRFLFFW